MVRLIVLVDRLDCESIGHKARLTVVIEGLAVCDPFTHNGNLRGLGIGHAGEIEQWCKSSTRETVVTALCSPG